MATKKTQITKKTVPIKKSEVASSSKKAAPVKKSSVVRKEIKPITAEETKISLIKTPKQERESISLLKEAIRAKSESAKNVSKPVSIKKHTALPEGNKEKEIKKTPLNEKATYSKKDIFKATGILSNVQNATETEKIKKEDREYSENFSENFIKKIDKQNEIEKERPDNLNSIPKIDDRVEKPDIRPIDIKKENINTSEKIEEEKKEEKKIINGIEDFKISQLPEIEKKPAKPYIAPKHSQIEKPKKSNSLIAILGILVIISGLGYIGYQFISSRNNNINNNETYVYESEETFTNSLANNDDTDKNTEIQTDTIEEIGQNTVVLEDTNILTNNLQNVEVSAQETEQNISNDVEAKITPTEMPKEPESSKEPEAPATPIPPKTPEFTPPTEKVKEEIETYAQNTRPYKIKWKDTLASIAYGELGDSRRWPTIFVLNRNILKTPDKFTFGVNIILPEGKKTVEQMTEAERESLYNDYMKAAEAYAKEGKNSLASSIKTQASSIKK